MREVSCNLCNSKDDRQVYAQKLGSKDDDHLSYSCTNDGHGQYYRIVRCKVCGLSYCSPRPDAKELKSRYEAVQDEIYTEELAGRAKTFQRSLKHLSQFKNKGRLLDVGCSIGAFLKEAEKFGWDATGIEPSLWCVDKAQKIFNIKTKQGILEDLEDNKAEFDVVTLWDVLEHVDNPLRTLKSCREMLKPGGVLALSTVNIGSFYVKLLGKRWPWFMKMHIYYFDKKTIKEYIEKSGLTLLKIKTYKHTVSIDYLLYKLKKINTFLYTVVRAIKKTVLFNKNIYITFGMGDFIEVYAKREVF